MARSHFSYRSLLRQRAVLAGLTLGFVVLIFWVFLELAIASQKTTVPGSVRRLVEPLNPELDLTVVEKLEQYENVTVEQARQGIRFPGAQSSLQPEASPSATAVPQTQEFTIPTNDQFPPAEPEL